MVVYKNISYWYGNIHMRVYTYITNNHKVSTDRGSIITKFIRMLYLFVFFINQNFNLILIIADSTCIGSQLIAYFY